MRRLTKAEVPIYRRRLIASQGDKCPLCEQPLVDEEAVLDHDHKGGHCRAALHRGCNTMLGKIEHYAAMCRLTDSVSFNNFFRNLATYQTVANAGYAYPTHKTEVEKKAAAKARDLKRKKKARIEALKTQKEQQNEQA